MANMRVSIRAAGSISGSLTPRGNVSGSVGRAEKVYENDYNKFVNKPQIEGNTLENDKTFDDLGMAPLSAQELADMWGE
ncbi:MAG: hypothetical protein K6F91_08175 [Ruminococcus sp.]|nr:hypothetical protein [Ruminococcus sp.]